MKCMIPGSNIKVFGRSIHCLSKIGDDLYIEPLDHGLSLRTVNSSRSAYASFIFAPGFFLSYTNVPLETNAAGTDEDNFRCRITMKSCLSVFKSLHTLEKTVDKCQMHVDLTECRLVFRLHCKHGIVKTYNLTYQETETLQAVYSRDLCPNHIVAHPKTLSEVIASFQTSQEEITLGVTPHRVSFKNYIDDEPDPSKVVRSEMQLSPSEFEDYTIGVDAELTFCLKELRAILTFSDAAGLPVSLHFESSGKPIVFAMECEQTLEATFVLATLADLHTSQETSQHRPSSASQHKRTDSQLHSQPVRFAAQQKISASVSAASSRKAKKRPNRTASEPPESAVPFPDDLNNQSTSLASARLQPAPKTASLPRPQSPVIPVTSNHRHSQATRPSLFPELDEHPSTPLPNRTLLSNVIASHGVGREMLPVRGMNSQDSMSDDDYDFVPGTPPSKKFKSIFFGASQPASQCLDQSRAKPAAVVLCEDTDEDD